MSADSPIWVPDANANGSGKAASGSRCCAASLENLAANRMVVPLFGAGGRRDVLAMGCAACAWPPGMAR